MTLSTSCSVATRTQEPCSFRDSHVAGTRLDQYSPAYRRFRLRHRGKPQKATVSILTLCTSVRSSLNSQDVYLAYISTPHHGRQLARLVDAYPGYERPIRASLLKQQQQFRIMLVRDSDEDVAYSALHMPGDESAHFGTVAPEAIADLAGGTLQSFLIIHDKTTLGLTKAVEPDR
jgi:hypothetical protein